MQQCFLFVSVVLRVGVITGWVSDSIADAILTYLHRFAHKQSTIAECSKVLLQCARRSLRWLEISAGAWSGIHSAVSNQFGFYAVFLLLLNSLAASTSTPLALISPLAPSIMVRTLMVLLQQQQQ